jgi:hypothetical protein
LGEAGKKSLAWYVSFCGYVQKEEISDFFLKSKEKISRAVSPWTTRSHAA